MALIIGSLIGGLLLLTFILIAEVITVIASKLFGN